MKLKKMCPICRLEDEAIEFRYVSEHKKTGAYTSTKPPMYECDCPRCHTFTIGLPIIIATHEGKWQDISPKRHLLSGIVRELNEKGESPPEITHKTIEELLAHPLVPDDKDFKAKAQKILVWLEKSPRYGRYESLNIDRDMHMAYTKDARELGSVLQFLADSKFIEEERGMTKQIESIVSGGTRLSDRIPIKLRLTSEGWDLASGLGRRNIESKQGFIAIRFDDLKDEGVDKEGDVLKFIKAISEGVGEAGFEPLCIKEKVFSETVMNKALSEISQSKFVIVDLTGDRPAVAFEAGYAFALGIEIIYVYRESEKWKPENFYARHYQLLPYRQPEDLKIIIKDVVQSRFPKKESNVTFAQ